MFFLLSICLCLPPGAARSAPPGCSPRRTSCPGTGARNNHGFFVAYLLAAYGRTYTAPPAYTGKTKKKGDGLFYQSSYET